MHSRAIVLDGDTAEIYTLIAKIHKAMTEDAIDANLMKPHGEGIGSKRNAAYVPFWA